MTRQTSQVLKCYFDTSWTGSDHLNEN